MNNFVKHAFDTVEDNTREIAETAETKTAELHKKYVSKVIPDCGKYGDAAKFMAEMVPGVSEYNAIREGDWAGFAVSAGIDVGALAIGAVTAGTGYAAIKGGSVAAKTGAKVAVKEVAETGAKMAVKEVAEKGVKEVVEEGAEKVVKEVVEDGSKEVVEKLDKKLIPKYLDEVEKITNREIKPNQMEKLEKALKEQDFVKLDPEESKLHRKMFDNVKDKLIDEWEKNTGEKWPVYTEDVLNDAGEVIREAGQRFDAHHLIESSFGGPNAWWNLHPAAFPGEHQAGIHAADSWASKIF